MRGHRQQWRAGRQGWRRPVPVDLDKKPVGSMVGAPAVFSTDDTRVAEPVHPEVDGVFIGLRGVDRCSDLRVKGQQGWLVL